MVGAGEHLSCLHGYPAAFIGLGKSQMGFFNSEGVNSLDISEGYYINTTACILEQTFFSKIRFKK